MQASTAFDALISFGLDEKQARAYLGLLQLQRATVLQLARATKLERSGLYLTLQELAKRGLIQEQVDERGSKLYLPISPTRLLDIERERMFRLEQSIPTLLAASPATNTDMAHPEVRWLQSDTLLEELYADIISTCASLPAPDRIVVSLISNSEQSLVPASLYAAYQQACLQNGIIHQQVVAGLPNATGVYVYGNTTACISAGSGYGMLFNNPDFAVLQRSMIQKVSQ